MDRLERPSRRRSPLVHGLRFALRHWRAFVWTWVLQLSITVLFTMRFQSQASALLSHSLAAAHLFSAFDLATVTETMDSLNRFSGNGKTTWSLGSFVFATVYFVLTPGVLACYQTGETARLRTLCWHGMDFFWRFIRITVAALPAGILLGALLLLRGSFLGLLESHGILGSRQTLGAALTGLTVLLVASLLRLYFDLVEVYAVQRSFQHDRRVGPAFVDALRLLRTRLLPAWEGFFLLTVLGVASIAGAVYLAIHQLASPHWVGMFAILQAGIAIDLFTRFWQRGAETVLAQDAPALPRPSQSVLQPDLPDAIPDPEPPAPSLPEPDRGIFEEEPKDDEIK